jgi:PKD repeat protein
MGESIRVRLYQQDEGKDFSITATSYTGTFNNQKVDSTTKKFSVVSKTLRGSNTAPAVLEALREGVVFNPVPGGNVQIAFKVCDAERDKTFMHIDFGDNTGAFREISGVCASRVWPKIYNSVGTYTVTLTIFDEFGEAVVMKRDIVIGSGGGWKGPAQIGFTKVNIDDYANFKDHRYMEKASPLPGELYPSSSLPIIPEPSSYQTFSGPIYSGAQRQTGQTGSRGQTPQESQGEVAGDPGCPIIDFQVLANYDRNNNRIIEPEEMLSAIRDYTAQQISRENAEAMVSAYFKQCKVGVKKSSSGSGGTLNQGNTPALGTANPVEAVNLETGDCRQFNSENEIPAGWEKLFPELGESCSSLNF